MGKLDDLRRMGAGNAAESMGAAGGATGAVHGARAAAPPSVPAHLQGLQKVKNVAEIPLEKIDRDPDQPREDFDPVALSRLSESIRTRGLLQPVRVRWDTEHARYVIIAGERRWRAARMAELPTLACIISEGPMDPAELLAVQLVENALREDLRPIEQARAFRRLMDRNGWSVSQIARELAIDHSNVSRALALLDLPESVQAQVERGDLPPATAYEVSKVADPAEQAELAARVVNENLSRAETVAAVRARSATAGPKGRGASKSRKPRPRVFRTAAGKATIELKRGAGAQAMLAIAAEVVRTLEAELSAGDQAAA